MLHPPSVPPPQPAYLWTIGRTESSGTFLNPTQALLLPLVEAMNSARLPRADTPLMVSQPKTYVCCYAYELNLIVLFLSGVSTR